MKIFASTRDSACSPFRHICFAQLVACRPGLSQWDGHAGPFRNTRPENSFSHFFGAPSPGRRICFPPLMFLENFCHVREKTCRLSSLRVGLDLNLISPFQPKEQIR